MINQVKKIVVQAALELDVPYTLDVTRSSLELRTDTAHIEYSEGVGGSYMIIEVQNIQPASFFTFDGQKPWDIETIRYLVNQVVEHHAK